MRYAHLLRRCLGVGRTAAQRLRTCLLKMTKPTINSLCAGTLADLVRSKPALIVENALLRQQLIILRRGARRPHCTHIDRTVLVLLAGRVRSWLAWQRTPRVPGPPAHSQRSPLAVCPQGVCAVLQHRPPTSRCRPAHPHPVAVGWLRYWTCVRHASAWRAPPCVRSSSLTVPGRAFRPAQSCGDGSSPSMIASANDAGVRIFSPSACAS